MIYSYYPIIGSEKDLPLYLLNMGLQYCQEHIIRKDGYPCPQFLYCTKGSGTLIIHQKKYLIPAYTGIFLPANYPHEYFPNEAIWDIHWVVPCGFALSELLLHFGFTKPSVYKLEDIGYLENLFRSMHETLRINSLYGNYKASGYLYEFIIEFNRIISQSDKMNIASNSALMKSIQYIDSHYTETITMDDLCAVSHVTKQHLCLLFRTTLQTRPMEYIAKKRIQFAKTLLISSQNTIEEIAEASGFCTASYFCKIFKRYEGMTPSQFRGKE